MADEETVPKKDLITFKEASKNREEKLKAEIEKLQNSLADEVSKVKMLDEQLKTAKVNLEDDADVKELRAAFEAKDKELAERERQIEKERTSLDKERKEVRATKLVTEYSGKGLAITEEDLADVQDMDAFVKDKYLEFLAKQNEELKTKPPENPAESVFEGREGGVVTKPFADMSREERDARWTALKQGALAKQK